MCYERVRSVRRREVVIQVHPCKKRRNVGGPLNLDVFVNARPPPSLPSVLKPPRTTRRAARTKKNATTTQAQISIEQFKEELGRGNVVTLTRRTKQKKERQWKREAATLKTVRAQKKPRRAATAFSVACVGRSRGRQQADGQAQAAGTTPRRRSSSCAAYPSGARCLHSSATYYPVGYPPTVFITRVSTHTHTHTHIHTR